MSDVPKGWSGDTRAEGSDPSRGKDHPATRADASAARTGRPLSALQSLAQNFEILGELGRGGMGVVYRARDREAGREVAIKLLLATPSTVRLRRFEREGATAARLRHKGIVAVHSAGQVAGQPYLVCELVEGARDFDEASEELPLEARLRLLREVIDAVAYAHSEGVIHRDLKPANVIVDAEGNPRVTDFGLARHEGDDRLTRTGASLGTPTHMAPEQARGQRDLVGPPADVWSLGIMLHEVVCGAAPFSDTSATPLEAYLKLQNQRPPSLRARGAEVSPALDALAQKALARDPGERFADAGALRDALDAALAEGLTGTPRPPLGLLILLLLATIGAYLLLSAQGAPPPTPSPPAPTATPTPSPTPSTPALPTIPVSELLAAIQAEPDAFRQAEAAWNWLVATPRAEGHERVRAFLRALDRPLRTHSLPRAARLAFLADGRLLVATRDGAGFFWSPKSDAVADLPEFKSGCAAIAVSPDRRSYAVLGNLRIDTWIYPGATRQKLPFKAGGIALMASGDVAVGHLGGRVEVFNPSTGLSRGSFQAHHTRIYFLEALSTGGLVTTSRTRLAPQENDKTPDTLKVWNAERKLVWSAPLGRRADSLSLDRAERYLVVRVPGGMIARYDILEQKGPVYFKGEESKDRRLGVPKAHRGEVMAVRLDPSGSYAYSTAWVSRAPVATEIRLWDAQSGRPLATRTLERRLGESDVSVDGRWFATISWLKGQDETARVELWAGLPPR
jgi:serine/threonine protein kinase